MIAIVGFALLFLTASCLSPAELTKPVNNNFFNTVCVAQDRETKICNLLATDGCLCYNNGTCEKQWVNKCIDCGKKGVFAVLYGQCPSLHPYLCPPLASTSYMYDPNAPKVTEVGCACSKNGKCEVKSYDKARKCMNEGDLAFFPNMACPAENLQAPMNNDNSNSKQVVCTPSLRYAKIACIEMIRDWGCVTYTDGSKAYVPVNQCTCQQATVTKYTVNQQC